MTAGGETPYKLHYYPISSRGTADDSGVGQTPDVGGGALGYSGVGLGGVAETGATTGYITMAEDADILRFRFALPETFVDTGSQADLKIQFYVDEQVTADGVTYDVNIYEFNNTTPILTDQFTVVDGAAAGWVDLVTNSTGFGNDSDIDADDILFITISPEYGPPLSVDHDANIYGCRIRYRPGIDTTN